MPTYQRDISISKQAAEWPWIAQCKEYLCYWSTAHRTQADAEQTIKTHTCPHRGSRRYNMKGKTIIEKYWDELDAEFDVIYQKMHDKEPTEWNAGRVRGIAWCLVELTRPHYTEVDQIMRQGKKRYQMRTGEIEFEDTPTYEFTPALPTDAHPRPRTQYEQLTTSGVSKTEQKAIDRLDPEVRLAIVKAVKQSILTPEQLARAYHISVKAVNALAAVDG